MKIKNSVGGLTVNRHNGRENKETNINTKKIFEVKHWVQKKDMGNTREKKG